MSYMFCCYIKIYRRFISYNTSTLFGIMLEKQMSVQCHVKFHNVVWPSVKSINHYIHMDGEYSIRNATFECSKIFFYNKFAIFSEIVIFNILFSSVPWLFTSAHVITFTVVAFEVFENLKMIVPGISITLVTLDSGVTSPNVFIFCGSWGCTNKCRSKSYIFILFDH